MSELGHTHGARALWAQDATRRPHKAYQSFIDPSIHPSVHPSISSISSIFPKEVQSHQESFDWYIVSLQIQLTQSGKDGPPSSSLTAAFCPFSEIAQ